MKYINCQKCNDDGRNPNVCRCDELSESALNVLLSDERVKEVSKIISRRVEVVESGYGWGGPEYDLVNTEEAAKEIIKYLQGA